MAKTIKNDPENYYKMSEPFESSDLANEAIKQFHDELAELRKKHKIRDVLIVLNGAVRYEDGNVGEYMICNTFGSVMNAMTMAAFAYGQEKENHSEIIGKLLANKKK